MPKLLLLCLSFGAESLGAAFRWSQNRADSDNSSTARIQTIHRSLGGNADMPTYVTLLNFTEQGARSIKDTVKRAEAYKAAAKAVGANVREMLWTQGKYDVIAITEGPDEATLSALLIETLRGGNVRSQTLRAMNATEMSAIIDKLKQQRRLRRVKTYAVMTARAGQHGGRWRVVARSGFVQQCGAV
jgi:uncharacterized protein with GYD domain